MTVRTCLPGIPSQVSHAVALPPCCPVSGNPRKGSGMVVRYEPTTRVYPVEDLRDMIQEYVDGHASRHIRNMEEMVQDIAQRVADNVGVPVHVNARLRISPPHGGPVQAMRVKVDAVPA